MNPASQRIPKRSLKLFASNNDGEDDGQGGSTMKKSRRKRKIESRLIESLKPHPSQAKLFDDLGDIELQCLADDIEKNGLGNPVEILPDGTIIAGHQRKRAAQLLGWTEIRCWVRDDLERKGEKAAEERLINDNLNRRQLSPLAVARCYVRLKEMKRDGYYADEDAEGDLRDHLAERFGVDGRTLDRYARMLKVPVVVQYAFERGSLTQSQVLAVVGLEPDQQQEIAECIENGELPSDVVQQFMERAEATVASVETEVFRLVRALEKADQQLKHRFDEIPGTKLERQVKKLASGQRFIRALQKQITQAIEHEMSNGDDVLDDWEFLDSDNE